MKGLVNSIIEENIPNSNDIHDSFAKLIQYIRSTKAELIQWMFVLALGQVAVLVMVLSIFLTNNWL